MCRDENMPADGVYAARGETLSRVPNLRQYFQTRFDIAPLHREGSELNK